MLNVAYFGLKLQVKGASNNFIFSIGFLISKILCFQMALNTCEMWFNGIKIAVFSKKLTKNRPTAGGFAPRPPKPLAAGDPPQTPVCDTFEIH